MVEAGEGAPAIEEPSLDDAVPFVANRQRNPKSPRSVLPILDESAMRRRTVTPLQLIKRIRSSRYSLPKRLYTMALLAQRLDQLCMAQAVEGQQ
ncbi:MAG: hypothetical protein R2867_25930 [Caldilineaceae bacterium]